AADLALLEDGEGRRCELIPTDHGAPACPGHGVLGPDRLNSSSRRVAKLYRLGQASVEAVEEVGRARLGHARRNAKRPDGYVTIGDQGRSGGEMPDHDLRLWRGRIVVGADDVPGRLSARGIGRRRGEGERAVGVVQEVRGICEVPRGYRRAARRVTG